jgi:hypothetical protein
MKVIASVTFRFLGDEFMSEKSYNETALLVATRGTRTTCVSGHLETELGAVAPGSKAAMPIGAECSPWYGTPMGLFYA